MKSDYKPGGGGHDNATKILVTSLSAVVAETTTFPIDLVKTRLQLHGESLSLSQPTNAFRVALGIIREQGPLGLYNGLSPAIIRHMLYTPVRIVGYENLRSLISADSGSLSLPSKAVVGGVSGVMAQGMPSKLKGKNRNGRAGHLLRFDKTTCPFLFISFLSRSMQLVRIKNEGYANLSEKKEVDTLSVIASPADLVKVRMQSDGCLVSRGLQPRYSGPFDALNKIIQSEGFLGLWKGVFPNIQRAFLVNMGELACYDHAKQFLIRNKIADDNVYAHTIASIMSGLCATTLSCPADVVKTRMMNQAANKEGKFLYSSSYDCLVKTVKVEGIRALWKGFFPTWARLGPWQFVFWVSYEKLRKIAGLSSF